MRESATVGEHDELRERVRPLGAAEQRCVSALAADEGWRGGLEGCACAADGGVEGHFFRSGEASSAGCSGFFEGGRFVRGLPDVIYRS